MKRIIIFALVFITATCTFAQPSKQRAKAIKPTAKTAQKPAQKSSSLVTERQKLQFPTSLAMPEDVVWRRDIYRELDLNVEENSPMYYPVEPNGKQMNVFTFIFPLLFLSSGSAGSRSGGHGHLSSGGNAEFLFQGMNELGELQNGQSLNFFNNGSNLFAGHNRNLLQCIK